MASEYYGLRGKMVKSYQKQLNSLGANLKVDGIWGKKTEAAYLKFMEGFNKLNGIGETTPEPAKEESEPVYQEITYAPRTEEALRAEAENKYGAVYDGQIAQKDRAAAAKQAELQTQMDALAPLLEQKLAEMMDNYERQRADYSQQAVSRGMGRSSYVTDQLAGSVRDQNAAVTAMKSNTEAEKAKLNSSLSNALDTLNAEKTALQGERESKILSAMDENRATDRTAYNDSVKYNNELKQQLLSQTISQDEFNRKMQLYYAQLAKK